MEFGKMWLRPGRAEDFFYILPPPALIEIAFPAGNHAHKPKISAPAAGNFQTIILSNLIFGACGHLFAFVNYNLSPNLCWGFDFNRCFLPAKLT